jgi:hypothetical protein
MLRRLRPHLSYANVVSTVCLFVLLGGSAYAAVSLKRGSVRGKHIAKNAITSTKVKNRALRAGDLARGVLPAPGISNIVVHRTDVNLPAGPVDNAPGDDAHIDVECAVDERMIGGAAAPINTSAEVLASRPASDANGNPPEDGGSFTHWAVRARTTGDAVSTVRVFAICAQTR